MIKTPIRSAARKKGISPLKISEISNLPKFSFEETSPSNVQISEGSPKVLLPKIPNFETSPNFIKKLNEKFTKKTSLDLKYKESFENYCNRAIMRMSQNEVENLDFGQKKIIVDIIRQQNKKISSGENVGSGKNK